jgi:hypothetical protein
MVDKKIQIFVLATLSFIVMAVLIVIGHKPEIAHNYITAPGVLALIALISYHTTLSLDNYAKEDTTLNKNVMRNAIAATFIVLYIAYFSFALHGSFGDLDLTGLTNNLTNLTMIVVGFYFGSDVASDLITKWKEKPGN